MNKSTVYAGLLLLLASAGCGRLGFSEVDDGELAGGFTADGSVAADGAVAADGSIDESGDAGAPVTDGGSPAPTALITDDFETPTAVVELNGSLGDDDPYLTPDELEIFYERGDNIYTASRESTDVAFDAPTKVAKLSSGNCEAGPTLSADGLTIYFHRTETSDCNNSLGHIFVARRSNRGSAFSTPTRVTELDLDTGERHPFISGDELRILFQTSPGPNLYEATRASTDDPFSAPQPLTELETAGREEAPWLSEDALTIVYARPDEPGGQVDLYVATRPTVDDPFEGAAPLTTVNSLDTDSDPWLSADGSRIYFSSRRNGDNGDIFTARSHRSL